jgi:uncharacterized protein (TIGR03437 family)
MTKPTRRRTLALLGGAGAIALTGPLGEEWVQAAGSCLALAGAQTEGPYWVDEMLNRSDIRVDPTDNTTRPGTLMNLGITVQEVSGSTCGPLSGAKIDIWHCDAGGIYSDEQANNSVGKKFLRGYQISDDTGSVQFTTIYPGWYNGRTVHIHVRIRTYSGSTLLDNFTVQIFFDDTITDTVFTTAPYNTRGSRDTRNANDMVLTGTTNGVVVYAALTKTSTGYTAVANIGVNVKTAAALKPVITAGGIVNAAGFQSGIAPAAWTTIFGQNLAATTHTVGSSDLVNGNLPTTLSGVNVQIDNQPAFLSYVSPTQINAQTPADSNSGSVSVTVTNAAGTSDPAATTMQQILPAFFASGKYVLAVRLDGTLTAPKPSEVVELYGTGFGPTTPAIAPGAPVTAPAPLSNPVTITIGAAVAPVSFAGLSAPGLYQFNITVPSSLADGDHEVIAQIAGVSTPSGILLTTKQS